MMAKLYWRIKRDGKWLWVAATPENTKYPYHRGLIRYIGPCDVENGRRRVLGYDRDIDDRPAPWKPEVCDTAQYLSELLGEEE